MIFKSLKGPSDQNVKGPLIYWLVIQRLFCSTLCKFDDKMDDILRKIQINKSISKESRKSINYHS